MEPDWTNFEQFVQKDQSDDRACLLIRRNIPDGHRQLPFVLPSAFACIVSIDHLAYDDITTSMGHN